jgi:hypothetical protein
MVKIKHGLSMHITNLLIHPIRADDDIIPSFSCFLLSGYALNRYCLQRMKGRVLIFVDLGMTLMKNNVIIRMIIQNLENHVVDSSITAPKRNNYPFCVYWHL